VVPDQFVPYLADPKDDLPCMASFGDGYRWHVTGLTHNDWGFPTNNADEIEKKMKRLMRKVDRFRDDIVEYETAFVDDAEILVLAYGSVARSSLSAVNEARSRGIKAGFFRPITLWPFPDKELEKLARKIKTIIVPEINCGQMVLEVERAVHGKSKVIGQSLVDGELFKPDQIYKVIEEVA
jgi:2-oxoglutarate ferredoxin oxidoreductase subunit alpha